MIPPHHGHPSPHITLHILIIIVVIFHKQTPSNTQAQFAHPHRFLTFLTHVLLAFIGELEYQVMIINPARYTLHVRNHHGGPLPQCFGETAATTGCECNSKFACNDMFVAMDELPWNKVFSNQVGQWSWTTLFKRAANIAFNRGQEPE